MQVTLASVTEDAPWAESRTTVRVRNYDVSALTAARCFIRVSRLRPLPLAPVTHRFHLGGMLAQGARIALHLTDTSSEMLAPVEYYASWRTCGTPRQIRSRT